MALAPQQNKSGVMSLSGRVHRSGQLGGASSAGAGSLEGFISQQGHEGLAEHVCMHVHVWVLFFVLHYENALHGCLISYCNWDQPWHLFISWVYVQSLNNAKGKNANS